MTAENRQGWIPPNGEFPGWQFDSGVREGRWDFATSDEVAKPFMKPSAVVFDEHSLLLYRKRPLFSPTGVLKRSPIGRVNRISIGAPTVESIDLTRPSSPQWDAEMDLVYMMLHNAGVLSDSYSSGRDLPFGSGGLLTYAFRTAAAVDGLDSMAVRVNREYHNLGVLAARTGLREITFALSMDLTAYDGRLVAYHRPGAPLDRAA